MRRLFLLIVLFAIIGSTAEAQDAQATLASPVVRNSEHNYRVESTHMTRDSGGRWEVEVSVRDSGGVEIRRTTFSGPDATHAAATVAAFNTALCHTVVGGETGSDARKSNFRVLTFLKNQSYTPITTATLVP